jgi:hypothetical protein
MGYRFYQAELTSFLLNKMFNKTLDGRGPAFSTLELINLRAYLALFPPPAVQRVSPDLPALPLTQDTGS